MKLFQLGLFFLTSLSCAGQNRERLRESTFEPTSFTEFKINLEKKRKDYPWVVDFKDAGFIDCRSDTSKLGFILAPVNTFSDEYQRVIFPKPAAAYLTERMPSFYSGNPDAAESLTFILKQLWVSERIVNPTSLGRKMLVGSLDFLSYCYLSTDCYATMNGEYRLVGSIDTVVSVRKWMVNAADDLLRKTMFETLNQANLLFKNRNEHTAPLSKEELLKKYRAVFNYPILTVEQPAKGVYLTYQDFLGNNPATAIFQVEKTKKKEIVHCNGIEDSVLAKAWGYIDSTGLNIHVNNNYYRAVKTQNTFEVAGPREVISLYNTGDKIFTAVVQSFFFGLASGGLSLATMGGHNRVMKELVPYQLNIHDGTFY
jgi:hypothetical protein